LAQAPFVSAVEPDELRARRRALGFTQAELADCLGVSANTVARWERGELRIRHPHAIARTLQRLEHRQLTASHHARRGGPVHHRRQADHTLSAAVRHNLPAELSSFIGRAEDIQQLLQRLRSSRLVTLVGAAGVGKTRLALQVARRALARYRDGVWLVELASTTDGDMVPNAVAAALGIREQPRSPLLTTLVTTLRDARRLLVLDNCEHLAECCAELAHGLLKSCPRLTILATSREPLRAVGEIRWPVAPLSMTEAVQLFVERARAAQPDFALTSENADPLADVCARLDGLPLAIELAAARSRTVPVRGLHQQLRSAGGGLPLLTGGPRDAPARHRTLHAAIAWSFDLLDPEEQMLFRRLAPFRGFTLEAATAVCVAADEGPGSASVALPPAHLEPEAGLASLVDKSLLHVEEDVEGQPWFSTLETVREFALKRLEASGESAAVWRRHALHYLRIVEQLEPRLQNIPQDVFVKRLQRDQANCRAALDWCQEHGYAEPSLRLGVGLWWFWAVRGQLAEGRSRLEALLARFPLRPSASAQRAILHAKALGAAGRLAVLQGDFTAARSRLEEAVRIADDLNDAEGLSVALEGLAYLALQQADYALARTLLERRLSNTRALARSTSPADPSVTWQTATTLGELGHVAFEQGDHPSAEALLEEARELGHQIGDTTIVAMFDIALGSVAHELGDIARARRLTEQGVALLEPGHDRRGLAIALANLGNITTTQREFGVAYQHLARSLRICQDMAEPGSTAFVLDRFAILASAQGQPGRAFRLAGAAAALRDQAALPLPAPIQRRVDQKLEPARRALGRVADAALSAGRSLTYDDAIAEALASAPIRPINREADEGMALSRREREVAALIARGCTNGQIAAELVIGQGTVATHVSHILAKLGLVSRSQVAVWVAQHRLLDEPAVARGERSTGG